jgi:hypothetical protein
VQVTMRGQAESKVEQAMQDKRREEAVCFVVAMVSKEAKFLQVCRSGDVERVKQLLGEGIDLNQLQVCVFAEHVF